MLILSLLGDRPVYALAFVGALLIALTIHEFSHAFVAFKLGDPTAKLEGRLTLNPIAHLDPVGTIFLLLAGFGWGKPVPINPGYFKSKTDEIKVALAGIISNLILASILVIPLRALLAAGDTSSSLVVFLSLAVMMNVILAVFNILPIPPLDGSHVVEYFLSEEAKYQYQLVGPYLLIGLIGYDYLSGTSIVLSLAEPIIRFIAGNQVAGMFFP